MVEVVGVFIYFSYFPDCVRTVGVDVGYNFCFVEVNAVFNCCRMFGYRRSSVLQSGVVDVF
jgi:hypothetical protein